MTRALVVIDGEHYAPVVRDARCEEVFRLPESLRYTARFMTVTCEVARSSSMPR